MKPALLLSLISFLLLGCREAEVEPVNVEPVEEQAGLTTPYQTLDYYLTSLREGDLEGVQRAMLNAENFYLPGPLPLDSFHVVRQDTLSAAQAAEYEFVPSPQTGDVEFDVREYFADSGEQMYTYHLRNVDGAWRIYSHSAWGVDVFDDEQF